MMHQAAHNSRIVKELAAQCGFSFCGISKAEFLQEDARRLENWLKSKLHAEMQYMENHFDKRLDPTLLVPGAKSVISLMYNYFPEQADLSQGKYKISRYAYGQDYHNVIKDQLFKLSEKIQQEIGSIQGRVFVDSAPVLERSWAARSGLGWVGKNSMLINKQHGSYFFLAEVICDLELEPDGPIKDYCGTCTACIDACPTDAIIENRTVDSNRCISYLTIELRNAIPNSFQTQMADWIFGCDICQEVCPWNRFAIPHHEPRFEPEILKDFDPEEWLEMTEEVFKSQFGPSAISRTGLDGIQRNVKFVNNKGISS